MTALELEPTTRFVAPVERFAPAPAERRGLARDGVRLLVAEPDRMTNATFAATLGSWPRRRPARRQRLRDGGRAGRRGEPAARRGRPARRDAARRRRPGSSSCARPADARAAGARRRAARPAAGREGASSPCSSRTPGGPPRPATATASGGRRPRATFARHLLRRARPIAYGYLVAPLPAGGLPDRLRGPPRQRRDAVGRAAVHRPGSSPSSSRAAWASPRSRCTPASPSQEAGEAPQAERFEVSASTARLVNAVASRWWTGRRGRHDGHPGPGVGGGGRPGGRPPRLDRAGRHTSRTRRRSSTA